MKKSIICKVLAVAAVSVILLIQTQWLSAESMAPAQGNSGITFDQIMSNAAKDGNIRITGSMTYGRFKGDDLYGFRGVLDYHLPVTGMFFNWSFMATGHFSLNKAYSTRQDFAGAGANLHVLQIESLDIFGGGAVGFTRVEHDYLPVKYPLTLDIHGGWTFFGKLVCVTGEIGMRYAEYFSQDYNAYINLTHFYVSLGAGIKI